MHSAQQQTAILQDQLNQTEMETGQASLDADSRVREAEAQLSTAEAQLAQQEASMKLAAYDRDAYTRLAKDGAVSERQGEQAQTTAESSGSDGGGGAAQRGMRRGRRSTWRGRTWRIRRSGRRSRRPFANRLRSSKRQSPARRRTRRARASNWWKRRRTVNDLTVIAPFDGTIVTRTAEPGEVIQAGTPIVTMLDLSKVYLRGFVPEGQIGRIRLGQAAHVFLDSDPKKPLDAVVSRIDPQATFTPENTYFRDDRVKQVVGLKLLLKSGIGYAKPGMPADGEVLVSATLAAGTQMNAIANRRSESPKHYGAVEAVRGIDFEVRQGEIFGLIGPDGAGKTSTFQILARRDGSDVGQGGDLRRRRRARRGRRRGI